MATNGSAKAAEENSEIDNVVHMRPPDIFRDIAGDYGGAQVSESGRL
ncbi:hypothetical protein ACWGM0_08010 [Sphingomonas bisphenolicum]